MGVRVEDGVIHLEGDCGVEDAEAVAAAVAGVMIKHVDLRECRHLHGAVVQALLVFRPQIIGSPGDEFLNVFVVPALMQPTGREPQVSKGARGRK